MGADCVGRGREGESEGGRAAAWVSGMRVLLYGRSLRTEGTGVNCTAKVGSVAGQTMRLCRLKHQAALDCGGMATSGYLGRYGKRPYKEHTQPQNQRSSSQLAIDYCGVAANCLFLTDPRGDAVEILGFFPRGTE